MVSGSDELAYTSHESISDEEGSAKEEIWVDGNGRPTRMRITFFETDELPPPTPTPTPSSGAKGAASDAVPTPTPTQPTFNYVFSDFGEANVITALTRSVLADEQRTFESGSVWGEAPVARTGDTVAALGCWPWTPYMDLTVLQPVEMLTENTARVRVRVSSLQSEPLQLTYLLELAAGPELYGRIHRWTLLMDAADPPGHPDNLANMTLTEGEDAEGFVYFEAPASQPSTLIDRPAALLYWSECWPKPVHLASDGLQ